jgi:hypothetical protein
MGIDVDVGRQVVGSAHDAQVALANVRVVVERAVLAGDPMRSDMAASFTAEDEAAPLLLVGRTDQRPVLPGRQLRSARCTRDP